MPAVPPEKHSGSLALITGASSGIGREVAVQLAGRGYRTILMARRVDRLQQLAGELSRSAPSFAAPIDLARTEDIEAIVQSVLREHGPVSVLINNAGFGLYREFLDHGKEDEETLLKVNCLAAAALMRLVLPGMLDRNQGHVINVASISTKMGPYGHAWYTAAKSALVSLTQTLAAEHQDSAVKFSYVNPGMVRTEFFENPSYAPVARQYKKRSVSAERVASAIIKLLDRPRLEVCVPGHYRLLDLIKAISPGFAHALVARQSRQAHEAVNLPGRIRSALDEVGPGAADSAEALDGPSESG